MLTPFALLKGERFRRWSIAGFVYSGVALCLVAFMTVQLTTVVGTGLVAAGQALAGYQIAGSVARPVWEWVADRFLTPARTLALQGLGMATAAFISALYVPGRPVRAVLANATLGGLTSGGYTGVMYAEYAALGGARRTEATGLGTAVLFGGCTVIPPLFGLAVAAPGGFRVACMIGAACALASGLLLVVPVASPIAYDQPLQSPEASE